VSDQFARDDFDLLQNNGIILVNPNVYSIFKKDNMASISLQTDRLQELGPSFVNDDYSLITLHFWRKLVLGCELFKAAKCESMITVNVNNGEY
jgi:hypothetical protein